MTRRRLVILLVGSFAGIAVALFNPVNSFALRLLFLFGIAGIFLSLFALARPLKGVRTGLIVLLVVSIAPLLLPSREFEKHLVREDYLQRLKQFVDVPYHWGGENSNGIDCSGLPRKALRDALFWHGLKTANGKPIRYAISQWWNDASAKAISEGYRAYASRLDTEGSIIKMSYNGLERGDLAVSIGGAHVNVYLGNEKWIEAAPEVGHVAIFDRRKDDNRWLKIAVTTHRWNVLQ